MRLRLIDEREELVGLVWCGVLLEQGADDVLPADARARTPGIQRANPLSDLVAAALRHAGEDGYELLVGERA